MCSYDITFHINAVLKRRSEANDEGGENKKLRRLRRGTKHVVIDPVVHDDQNMWNFSDDSDFVRPKKKCGGSRRGVNQRVIIDL